MIVIEIGPDKAQIDKYKWTSNSISFEKMLNSYLDPTGTSPSDPNPDLTEAKRIVKKFNGRIIKQDKIKFSSNSKVQY